VTKSFDVRVLGSITSGILLLQDFSKVHEAIEWLAGYQVWTHELPAVSRRLAPSLLERFPHLPARDTIDDWRATADALKTAHPDDIALEQGAGERTRDPVETLHEKLAGGDGAP
jgi:hypothetical protein